MSKRPPANAKSHATPQPGVDFKLGELLLAKVPLAYRRARQDPIVRPLRIYACDPTKSRLEGNVVTADVPYEPLRPGPAGELFEVKSGHPDGKHAGEQADLEDRLVVLRDGHAPSESDPRFAQQMVYAVCSLVHRSFRRALGRQIGWGGKAASTGKLAIYPLGEEDGNAYYDAEAGALIFGYFKAATPIGRTPKGAYVYTALSHDVIAHEMTHALLDGLRANFLLPSGPDVAGFHEGFADLVALFHHFEYREAVRDAIAAGRGDLRDPKAAFLYQIAPQFGQADGVAALRSALSTAKYDRKLEYHDMGEVLLAAVYDAFCTVYRRKTERVVRLATWGTGVHPAGALHPLLVDELTDEAVALAAQFRSILIRAIDYCPPVDLHLGEYLQAIITADRELVREDPWGYREAFIDAFRERGVTLRNVASLSEDTLAWRPPRIDIPRIEALSFKHLRFEGEPGRPMARAEVERQAVALGQVACDPRYMAEFGLVKPGAMPNGARADKPVIESIRAVRRAGPDGAQVFDLVAEISQHCRVPKKPGRRGFTFYGGGTILIGPDGEVRYAITKSVGGAGRVDRRAEFLKDPRAQHFWEVIDGEYVPKHGTARLLHVRNGRKKKTG